MTNEVHDLRTHPVHLGLGSVAEAQPAFTGMDWYAAYSARTVADGTEGRLVSMYDFTESWDSWEMHPAGDELVVCLSGALILHQELANGTAREVALKPGEYAINPPGTWHTADVDGQASALFITAGQGTLHRPR